MFPAWLHPGFIGRAAGAPAAAHAARSRASSPCTRLRTAGLTALLFVALSRGASAQGQGTMQISAQVVPAPVGWTGLAEARLAALALLGHPLHGTVVRRAALVRSRAELVRAAGHPHLVVVTIQHPHN